MVCNNMKKILNTASVIFLLCTLIACGTLASKVEKLTDESSVKKIANIANGAKNKPRVIVTSDGEVDDECSLVRFLLYANDWEVAAIVTSSSQYHWQGHKWAGDDWAAPYLDAYQEIYPNLVKHDADYPSPAHLRAVTVLGNVEGEGEMEKITAGSELIVKLLLDESDNRPIWLQAWGGTNTIARALKTIEEQHPEKMSTVAKKLRFFFIWEQDRTYQDYILPKWGKYNILTIISDQFWAIAYQWNKIIPKDQQKYFKAEWMKKNILEGHGALASLYKAHVPGSYGLKGDTDFDVGDFRSEGDSPAFLHTINTGLANLEHPDFGGWGGRYVNVYDNVWLDAVPVADYQYPQGRWFTKSAWGRMYMRATYPNKPELMNDYFKPLTRWSKSLQNDFAARADWSVKSPEEANHPPVVTLAHSNSLTAKAGSQVHVSASGSYDPDSDELSSDELSSDELSYQWWQYQAADTYPDRIDIKTAEQPQAWFVVPKDAQHGQTIHLVVEVTDNGSPQLTRYQRVVVAIK